MHFDSSDRSQIQFFGRLNFSFFLWIASQDPLNFHCKKLGIYILWISWSLYMFLLPLFPQLDIFIKAGTHDTADESKCPSLL